MMKARLGQQKQQLTEQTYGCKNNSLAISALCRAVHG
jgi:hypothetical protein